MSSWAPPSKNVKKRERDCMIVYIIASVEFDILKCGSRPHRKIGS